MNTGGEMMKKDDRVKYIALAAIVVLLVGYFLVGKVTSTGGLVVGDIKVSTVTEPPTDSRASQQVIVGGNTTINYVKLLNVSVMLSNTGSAGYTNVRITSTNPATILSGAKCSAAQVLPAGGQSIQMSCLINESDMASIGTGSKSWWIQFTGFNTYIGADDAPRQSGTLNVDLEPDLTGSFTATMSVNKQG
jgi:hypothetical protein